MTLAIQKPNVARATSERIRLLVKELGSSALTSGGSDDFDETLVIAQLWREPPAAFARRVMDRLATLQRSERSIACAMVQASGLHDAAAGAARRSIALTLASHALAYGGTCELVLDAPADSDGPTRQELIGLVDQLVSSTMGEALPVRLCFSSSSRPAPETKSAVSWRALEDPS